MAPRSARDDGFILAGNNALDYHVFKSIMSLQRITASGPLVRLKQYDTVKIVNKM